jgi:hypothetical protein
MNFNTLTNYKTTILHNIYGRYVISHSIACILKAHSHSHSKSGSNQSELPLSVNAVFEQLEG